MPEEKEGKEIKETENVAALKSTTEKPDTETIDLAPYIYPLAAFLIPLLFYWRTMCKALYIGDGGDFITASYTLGVPHPPGYPLYTLLGKLFLSLPIPGGVSQAAWRMNFMSAFFGALTTLLVYFLIRRITKCNWLAFFAALAVAFARTFWSQAVITEVYTLNTFFMLLQLNLLLIRTETGSRNSLIWMGLALGLSLAHHPSIAIFFPAYIYYSYVKRDHDLTRLLLVALAFGLAIIRPVLLASIIFLVPHEILAKKKPDAVKTIGKTGLVVGIVLFVLSLCLYAYLPLAGYANPVTGKQKFETPAKNLAYFLETVTRKVYDYKATTPGEAMTTTPMVFGQYLKILWWDFSALVLIFILAIIPLRKKDTMTWSLFICYLLFMITVLFYPSGDILRAPMKNLDVVMPPLMIPAQLIYILLGFIGIGYLLNWIPDYVESMKEVDPMPVEKKIGFLNAVIVASLIVLTCIVIPFTNWRYCDKSRDLVAYNYARNVMRNAPDDSFVLNTGDETFLFWYLTIVEKYLPEKKIALQNWIHNIRDFTVLKDENKAIREVLWLLLNHEKLSEKQPEIKEDLGHFFGYKHYCTTFLTEEIQKDAIFSPYDCKMHGLIYEFVKKPKEYYVENHYSIHPDYGIVPNSMLLHENLINKLGMELEKLGFSEKAIEGLITLLRIPKPDYDRFLQKRFDESYYNTEYPGMRLSMDYKIPYNDLFWDGLFIVKDIPDQSPGEEKMLDFELDQSYRDPQEQEIIGRYQEMFHNIGSYNMNEVRMITDEEKKGDYYFRAVRSFRHEITLKPSDPPGWLALGDVFIQTQRYDDAINALEQYMFWLSQTKDATMQNKADAHYYLALVHLFKGNFNKALQEADSALIIDPDNPKTKKLRQAIIDQEVLFREKVKKFEEFEQNQEEPQKVPSEAPK
jgi:tetratricopeptide (TPR) repeat protein